jgi:hypothetical protein
LIHLHYRQNQSDTLPEQDLFLFCKHACLIELLGAGLTVDTLLWFISWQETGISSADARRSICGG